MIAKIVLTLSIFLGSIIAQAEMNYSYEMKYGDGNQVKPLTQDTTDYSYFENILEINTTFSNGVYLFTQLEYSDPPILGETLNGLSRFYLDYYWDRLYLKVGDIYSLQGRGLTLNLMQDQNIDYDNSVRGLETRFNILDFFSLYAILGQAEYKYRSDPAERENDKFLDSKLGFIGFEHENDLIGTTSSSILVNEISSKDINHNPRYTLTEYDISLNKQIANIDIYIEAVLSGTDVSNWGNGSKFYATAFMDLYDYGITYEYKNYNLDSHVDIISANPPIVFRESSSTLISSNIHSINWRDEIGHQIEINKKFSDHFIIQTNTSFSYRHPKEGSANISLMDILQMDENSGIHNRYPFRQTYFEASGWINKDNIYYKVGVDQFDDFKMYNSFPFSVSAYTIPSIFTIKLSNYNSATIYAEYQQRKEINYITEEDITKIDHIDNFFDNYFSVTYNYQSLLSLTLFYRQELYKGKWGAYWNDLVEGNWEDIDGPPANTGNIETWRGLDVTYNINSSTQISIFTGSQKGGLVCANGICAVQPGFDDGYKITFRSLF